MTTAFVLSGGASLGATQAGKLQALGALGVREHSFSPSGLRRVIERDCDFARLEDAAVPLQVVAADVLTGEEMLLSEGSVVDALLASAAIPGVFPPVARAGRLLTDGGIVNNAGRVRRRGYGGDARVV